MTRIARIEVAHWSQQLRETMAISRGGFRERHHTFVKCSSDTGYVGFGEAVGDWRRIHSVLRSGLGIEVLLRGDIHTPQDVWGLLLGEDVYFESLGSIWAAVSAIEMALADLEARQSKFVGAGAIGHTSGDYLEAYASNIYWDHPKRMAEVARRIVERGVHSVKVHIGVASPIDELSRLQAVRAAIGPQTSLMVDLNCGYSANQAIEAGQLWADLDVAWLEEPVFPSDWAGLESVASNVPIPIALGENLGWLSEFRRAVDCGAQVLMPDAGRVGMYRCREVDELCCTSAVTYSPHNYSSGVLLGATVALLNASIQPGPLEIDLSNNSLYEELWGPLQFDNVGNLVNPKDRGKGLLPKAADSVLDRLAWIELGEIDRFKP